jgi:hypothetical protein
MSEHEPETQPQEEAQPQEPQKEKTDAAGEGTTGDPRLSPSVQEQTQSSDPAERQKDLGFNPKCQNFDPDAGQAQMQEAQDNIDAKGFIGGVPDPTPNENYFGVNSTPENNLPTPETDRELFDEARKASLGHPLENIEKNSVETATSGGDQ